jgi:hypothetical protein
MSLLKLAKVAVSLHVKLSDEMIEQHAAASPHIIGEELARQVAAYVQQQRLGYYPALDYFRDIQEVDDELLQAAENLSWLVCGLVREELRTRLRAVFSNLKFESIQTVAYTMPTVRPGNNNALHDLAQHFTPDQVRVSLVASSIRRHDNDSQIAIKLAKHQICRWLKDRFATLEITNIRYLPQN